MTRSRAYTDTLTHTSQRERVPGREDQVENYAGGYAFELNDWGVLDRFLILGTESPTYYASAQRLTVEALDRVLRCVESDPRRVVDTASRISLEGRAPSNSPAIFALALVATRATDRYDKSAAYHAIMDVCRTGTHLFEFVDCVKRLKGSASGQGLRRALQRWYTQRPVGRLEYQLLKYRQRHGWSHRDLLRISKPRPDKDGLGGDLDVAFGHAVGKPHADNDDATGMKLPTDEEAQRLLIGFEAAQSPAATARDIADLIREYKLTREMVPTEALAHKRVWKALLPEMPMTALLRNLGKLTSVGAVEPLSTEASSIAQKFRDVQRIKKARMHPAVILNAYKIYQQGHGERGSLTWQPIQEVSGALDEAFNLAFDAAEPTGKRFYLGIDVSGSMNWSYVAGLSALTAAEGAAAMAMSIARVEPRHVILGFAGGDGRTLHQSSRMRDLGITPRDSMPDVLTKTRAMTMGRTDCALPMLDAMERGIEVDCFVILTDNETWFGRVHPFQALRQYRQKMGIHARLAVVGMTGTQFTIADPKDDGMLDVVGFDANAPGIIQRFAAGEL